jgi:O-antigen/teichoic acid export membrane protein
MGLRALLRGSLLYTLGNMLPRLGAFLLLPVYTAAMAPAEFGVFSLMLSLSGLLAIMYRLGLDGALLRIHFDIAPVRRPSLYLTLASVTLAAVVAFSLLLTSVGAALFGVIFPGVSFAPYGVLALLITATTAFQYIPSALFRATERPGRFLTFGVGAFGVGVIATLFFLIVVPLGAVGGLLGQLATGVAVVCVTVVILVRVRRPRIDRSLAREGLAFGLPLVPHGMAAWVLSLSDRWLIGLFLLVPAMQAQAAIGVYAFGYVIAQVVSLVAMSFNAAWVPFFFARGDDARGPEILTEMTTLSMAVLSVLAVGIAAFAPEITRLVAVDRWGSQALVAADVMQIVTIAFLAHGLYFMVVSAVFLRRRTRGLPLITLAAGMVNVGANVVLIPRLGIVGAAWSTLAGYLVLAGITWWYARLGYMVRMDVARIASLATAVVLAVVVSRLLDPGRDVVMSTAGHAGIVMMVAVVAWLVARRPLAQLQQILAASSGGSTRAGHATADTMHPPEEDA